MFCEIGVVVISLLIPVLSQQDMDVGIILGVSIGMGSDPLEKDTKMIFGLVRVLVVGSQCSSKATQKRSSGRLLTLMRFPMIMFLRCSK